MPFDGLGLVTGAGHRHRRSGRPRQRGAALRARERPRPGDALPLAVRALGRFSVLPALALAARCPANGCDRGRPAHEPGTAAVAEDREPGALAAALERRAQPVPAATRFTYTLPERGRVRLAVYDVAGRRRWPCCGRDAGRRTRTPWDGRDAAAQIPAGVYFLRLEFHGRVETQKIVIAR